MPPDATHHADRPPDAHLLNDVIALARRAGDAVLRVYDGDIDVVAKADASPLTEADLAAHRLLADALGARPEGWPVVSEENERRPEPAGARATTFWLIDPLDGTKEFIGRNGEFTVNVALVRRGVPVLGVVHAPALGVTYAAAEGLGARREDADGARDIGTAAPDAAVRVVASRSHGSPETEAVIAALGELGPVERTAIGSSLKLCLVADGAAHYYPRLAPTMAWDTAAAHAVLREAGGEVLDDRGSPLRYPADATWRNPHFVALYAHDAPLPYAPAPAREP